MGLEELTLEQVELYSGGPFKEMIEAGVFYGRKKTKTHPRMKPYIFANRGGIEIIDLQKALETLAAALAFLKEKVKKGALILLVGTQPAAQGILAVAKEFNFPYVARRWIGGTLTNFQTISKRVEYMKKLKDDSASGALQKYTKKERVNIEREIKRLEELLGGLENLNRAPDLLIMIDPVLHMTAVREARRFAIPVIAFSNTDADIDMIDYSVLGNTAARKSVGWFLEKVTAAIREGKSESAVPVVPEEAPSSHEKQGSA